MRRFKLGFLDNGSFESDLWASGGCYDFGIGETAGTVAAVNASADTAAASAAASAAAEASAASAATAAAAGTEATAATAAAAGTEAAAAAVVPAAGTGLFGTGITGFQAASLGLSGLSAIGSVIQGQNQSDMYNQAAQNAQNAEALRAQQRQLQLQQTLGAQAALYGLAGVDTNVGTPTLVAGATAGNAASSNFADQVNTTASVNFDKESAQNALLKGYASAAGTVGQAGLTVAKQGNLF